MKKLIAIALCLVALSGCAKKGTIEISGTVTRDEKYNAAVVSFSPDEFSNAGFKLGDSCDIVFGNGYTIRDVPYYNGYYVKNNEPVIVFYPGFTYISITYNNNGIWDTAGLKENETITIRLNESGKYSAVQETLGQEYSFEYKDYDNGEEFCNFRALSGGSIREEFLFRGASPVDNSRGRASYTDGLLAENGISYVVDLADSEEDMEGYLTGAGFDSPYTAGLYEAGRVVLLDMSSSYSSDAYKEKVAEGMLAMLNASGPIYIHCMEGKDRTGFVCMLLEALAGATYDEMLADYMVTYENYYSVSREDTPEKYDAISELYFDAFVSYLHGTDDPETLKNADYVQDAVDYLVAGGMTENEVWQLQEFITD